MIWYGLATALTVALCARSRPTLYAALILAGSWAASNALLWAFGEPAGRVVYPAIDFLCGGLCVVLWSRAGKPPWLFALAATFIGDCLLHVDYWTGRHSLHDYALSLNVCYSLQLIIANSPGGKHVADRFLGWVPSRALGGDLPRHPDQA